MKKMNTGLKAYLAKKNSSKTPVKASVKAPVKAPVKSVKSLPKGKKRK